MIPAMTLMIAGKLFDMRLFYTAQHLRVWQSQLAPESSLENSLWLFSPDCQSGGISRNTNSKTRPCRRVLELVTLSHSLYKVIVAEIIRWNETLRAVTAGGNLLQLAN